MDYKYIEQLLERYWQCETSLEEEEILRAFFSQKEVPQALLPYKDLFTCQSADLKEQVLSDDFDDRILAMTEEKDAAPRKTLTRRLMPLFKAAAIVAIILTLGNAMQVPFQQRQDYTGELPISGENISVARGDSAVIDSTRQNAWQQDMTEQTVILK